ncbi:autophagy- protein 2 [Podila epigama]|nr:autophagy- protein 2 [Podila epigama]
MKAWGLGNFFSSFAVPAGLQKRLVSFLLQRAIGHFLQDELDLEKLDIELSNGIVHLTDLQLNTRVLNNLVAGTPLAIAKGQIGSITATIPWRNLWNGQCVLEINGIDITLVPVQAQPGNLQDLEEQLLSSSVNLANDFLHQKPPGKEGADLQESLLQTFQAQMSQTPSGFPGDFNSRPLGTSSIPSSNNNPAANSDGSQEVVETLEEGEGIQFVAKLIEKLMARIQIICKDTVVRLRHSSSLSLVQRPLHSATEASRSNKNRKLDYELQIRLPYIAYKDETPGWDQHPSASVRSDSSSQSDSTMLDESIQPSVIWQDSPESIKTVTFKGFSVWIKQQNGSEEIVTATAAASTTQQPAMSQSSSKEDGSDSDDDVFTDAQEDLTQSIMTSRILGRSSIGVMGSRPSIRLETSQEPVVSLYEAEIISTLQHKNRVKVNIRKNATMFTGTGPTTAAPSAPAKTILDIDFYIKSIFVAISPSQVGFIMEVLTLMENAPSAAPSQDTLYSKPPQTTTGRQGSGAGECFGDDKEVSSSSRPSLSHDIFLDRQNALLTQLPISPTRSQASDAMRLDCKSPGGRPIDHNRYYGSENRTFHQGGTIRTPAIHMDSSRFLSGSTYSEMRQGPSSSSSTAPSSPSPSLTLKLKARIATFQIFVLYHDPLTMMDIPTAARFFKTPIPEALKADHCKVELDSMILRYQRWTTSSTGGGQSAATKSTKGQVDFTLSNLVILEWIDSPPQAFDTEQWKIRTSQYRLPPRKQYIPIVEFDVDQESHIQNTPSSRFSTLQLPERYLSDRSISLRSRQSKKKEAPPSDPLKGTSTDTKAPTSPPKEVIRMRVILGGKMDTTLRPGTPSTEPSVSGSSSGYAQDVTIEVKPFQIHVDFFMIQRLERYLVHLTKPSTVQSEKASTASCQPSRTTEQQIMEDLEGGLKVQKAKTRLRLRLNSVLVWVSVPDMALSLRGVKDTGPEYRSIYDIIAIHISKLVATHASDSNRGNASIGTRERSDGRPLEDLSTKFKIDFSNVSAFVVPAHEASAKAVLSVGSLPSHVVPIAGFHSLVPNIEITSRPASSLPVHYQKPSKQGFPRTPVVNAFAILENEENVHNPDDEEQELLSFKQRTIETSLLVVNTHLPLIAVHLEKRIFDTLMLRVNDMTTWLAMFFERLAAQMPPPPVQSPMATFSPVGLERHLQPGFDAPEPKSQRGSFEEYTRDDQSEHGTDQSTAYGEELRHQAEGIPPRARLRESRDIGNRLVPVKPTNISVLVFAQNVDVILDYPTTPSTLDPVSIVKTYQINAGECRTFTAIKYQGGLDTYLSVDAEDLDFWETTTQKVSLLTRTIPKAVKVKSPKPMFHMTSLLSFDPVVKFKENDTNLAFHGISWKFSVEQTAVDDVQDFFAEPAGIIYWNPPHQCTRIHVSLSECGMDYKPLHIPSRFVLSFEKMKVNAVLIPESPTLRSRVQIYNMNLFLIDRVESILSPQYPTIGGPHPGLDARQFWSMLGFVQIGQCPFFELRSVKSKNGQLPLYDLTITNQMFYLETCSDSFETFLRFASYMGDNGDLPLEKKKILERLAEAERAANRAKSNIIYQDMLVASLDEDAFRKPNVEKELDNAMTLDFVEEFFSVEREDSENDLYKAQIRETPNVDGFHEVYADLLSSSRQHESGQSKSKQPSGESRSKAGKSSWKQKSASSTSSTVDVKPSMTLALDFDRRLQETSSRRGSMEGAARPLGSNRARNDTGGNVDEIIRVLDQEATFQLNENHFSVPVMTQEERARDEKTLAKMRIRVRDFNFSWRLYDGLDWEISRLDEAERKRQARQLANRLYDPNDAIHSTMDSTQSNLEASIFERLSGMQPRSEDRGGAKSRKDFSPSSSEADTVSDYQNDMMSQAGGRPSSSSSSSGRRRQSSHHHHHHPSSTHESYSTSSQQKRKKKMERSKSAMIEFNAERIRVEFEDYVSGVEKASHLSLRVKEFEIIDNLKSSLWHKFLSHQRIDTHAGVPRQSLSNMIRVDLDGVRPVVSASTVEYRLNVKILPLRLYIDQDALIFLIRFFVQGTSGNSEGVGGAGTRSDGDVSGPSSDDGESKKPSELYFQSVRLGELAVKLDYKPKHVDYTGLSGGNFVELMNFFHLDAAEMTLQEVHLRGINGVSKLGQDLISSWLPHIRSTQVPHMVSGLTPIRSLVNLGAGIADLVLLPIEQYKRDGHIIRGLQKGGQAFTRATTLEALKIGTKLAVGTQVLLEHADEIFGSGAGTSASHGSGSGIEGGRQEGADYHGGKRLVATMAPDGGAYMQESIDDEDQLLQHLQYQQQQQQQQQLQQQLQQQAGGQGHGSTSQGKSGKVSKYANQPADINEGNLSKNIGTATHTIFAVPMEVYERTGAQGSVRAVIRAVPVAVLKPMIGATEAFSKVLIGLRNSIDPAQRLQMEDKYKRQ